MNEERVKKIITNLKDKSCKIDPMPTSLIKKCANELAPIITFIINDIFDSGNYPVQLKEATLTPIIKKPSMDTESLGSYRPVSQNCF